MGLRLWDIYWRQATPSRQGAWFGADQMMRWLPGYLHWFAGGMVLAVVGEWIAAGRRLPAMISMGRTLAGVFVGDRGWVVVRRSPSTFPGMSSIGPIYRRWFLPSPPHVRNISGLPAVLGGDRGLIRAGLRSAPLAWVGLVSYGLYLWHRPIQHYIIEHTSGIGARTGLLWTLGRYALAGAASLVFAAASWYLIERPMNAVSHRLCRRRRRGQRKRARRPRDDVTPSRVR